MKTLRFGLSIIALIAVCLNSWAYDFIYSAQDKLTYYNITSSNTVAITYGPGYNSYEGKFTVWDEVTYQGKVYKITEIAPFAFRDCKNLTKVTFSKNIKKIGNGAFQNCENLESVEYYDLLEELGDMVFYNCPKLLDFAINVKCNSISSNAFKGSSIKKFYIYNEYWLTRDYTETSNLGNFLGTQTEEVWISDNCTYSPYLLANCPNLKIARVTGAKVSDFMFYKCPKLEILNLTEHIESLGNYACFDCPNLREVRKNNTSETLKSLKSIGHQVFAFCPNLEEFCIEPNVESVGRANFEGCKNINLIINNNTLTSKWSLCGIFGNNNIGKVTFGNEVKTIGADAFAIQTGHTGIQTIEIGPNVTSIATSAFTNQKTETVIINSKSVLETPYSSVASNIPSIFGNQVKSYIIGGAATTIGYQAFNNSQAEAVVFKAPNISVINPYAFSNNTKLRSLALPASLVKISQYAFKNCSALSSLIIPDNVTTIDAEAFAGNTALSTLTIGKGVSNVAETAFKSCDKLYTVYLYSAPLVSTDYASNSSLTPAKVFGNEVRKFVIGNNITKIGDWAFAISPSLNSIELPSSVKTIGQGAFANCNEMTSLSLSDVTDIKSLAFQGCDAITELYFGSKIQNIGTYAFRNCKSLTSVAIPSNVLSIGTKAFNGCPKLTEVMILNSPILSYDYTSDANLHHIFGTQVKKYLIMGTGSTKLGSNMLDGSQATNNALEEIVLYRVNATSTNTFSDNRNLKTIDLHTLTTLGGNTFANCLKLASITLPEALTSIENHAFSNCGLTSIDIPKSVKNIGYGAFNLCDMLQNVTFASEMPSSAIDQFAFRECNNIKVVNYMTKNPGEINPNTFSDDAYDHAVLTVAPDMVSKFKSLKGWENFYNIKAAANPDVNRDNEVNASDVVSIYNFIISGTQSGITKEQADVNGDGNVNAADVVAVYNYIIDGQ